MSTVIDLLTSVIFLTASPWLWVLLGVIAVLAVGTGVSTKGLHDAKKGEKEQAARKQAEALSDTSAEITAEDVAEKPVEEEEKVVAEEVPEEPTQEEAGEVGADVADEPVEEVADEPVEEAAEEAVEEVAEEPVEEVAEEGTEETVEEPVEEVAEEKSEEIAEQAEEAPQSTEEPKELPAAADSGLEITVDTATGFVFYNGYRRSFESRLIQSREEYKGFYSQIKNKLLSYNKIHARLSWSCESFRYGRKLESKITFRGKTLCLFLALDPAEYPENIYHQRNLGDKKKYQEVPMMVRVRSHLGLKRALTLIELLMEKEGIALAKKYEEQDYSKVPFEEDAPLIERGLIKVVQNKRAVVLKDGETQEQAIGRIIEEIKETEQDEEDFAASPEELAEELEYTVDEEQHTVFYTVYRRSFESRLIQSKEPVKGYYQEIKNKLLSYKKISARMSWACESFRNGRPLKAKLTYRGKTLCLFLALDPTQFPENIYHQRNMGDKKKYADVPMMVRVRSDLGLKRALALVEELMKQSAIPALPAYEPKPFGKVDYEPDAPLIERGLIKLGKGKRSIVLKAGETEEDAVKRIVEEIKEAEREEDELQYTVDEEQQAVVYTIYRRSFTSKLIQSSAEVKGYYTEIKNTLVSYKKVHARTSWACESFRLGRVLKSKVAFRGRTLCLFLALDPAEYPENVYHQRDMGAKKKYAAVPMMVRVRSARGVKKAVELIKVMMTIDDVPQAKGFVPADYTGIPYEADAPLIERGLIKLATGKRAFFIAEGETKEEAVQRTVEAIKADNRKEEEPEEPKEAAPEVIPAPVVETPEFTQAESEAQAPETVEAPVEELAFAEQAESEEIPEVIEAPIEEAPAFVEQQEEEFVPEEIVAPVEEAPEFAEQEEQEAFAPETMAEPQAEEPSFVEGGENAEEIPDVMVAPVEEAPTFAEQAESEDIPDIISAPVEEAPDFAGESEQAAEVPTAFEAPQGDTPAFAEDHAEGEFIPDAFAAPRAATPDFVESEAQDVAPQEVATPEGAFVPAFDAPDADLQADRVTQFASPEEAFLAFASPDEDLGAAPARLDVVSESGPVIPKEILEEQLQGVSDDYFSAAPTRLVGLEPAEVAPAPVVVHTQDLFGRPLPKGLYDEVPMKRKKVAEPAEPEVKREIPTGELSPEDAKKVAEDQAALDALIEQETDVPDDEDGVYEIVGVAEDVSAFTAFENKLLTANNKTKYFYSEIKNTIMSYKHVKCKTSNAGDSFRQGNNLIARITLNNNKLRLHLCLDPKKYSVNTYNHYSLKNIAAYQEVPFTLELLSRKDLLNATKLVQDAMASKYVIYVDEKREYVDYAAMYTLKS